MPSTVSVLVNPASGRGRAAVAASRLLRELRALGADPTVLIGRSAADSARLAREAVQQGSGAVVAVGGDGLANVALQAVVGTDVPLGLVPAGTGNDIARAFGLPRSVPAAASAIVAGRTVTADTVRAGDRSFLSVLACGFDSRVNERVNGFRYSVGRSGYLLGVLAELRAFEPVPFDLLIDGEPLSTDAVLVAAGNTTSYGGGMRVCPGAEYDDGLLDVVIVHAVPRARFLRAVPRVFSGTHTGLDEVTVVRCRTLSVRARPTGRPPVRAYADGEDFGALPFSCEVAPASVRVLA